VVVKVEGMEQEEAAVVAVAVRGGAGNDLPQFFFSMIFHLKGTLSRYSFRIIGLSHGMTAACSAGPAFEGGGIRWGMRAEEGAIEKVTIDPQTLVPELSMVGEAPSPGDLRVGNDRSDCGAVENRHR
jgi:hypothetical protein